MLPRSAKGEPHGYPHVVQMTPAERRREGTTSDVQRRNNGDS